EAVRLLKCQARENKIRLRRRDELERAARIISFPTAYQVSLTANEFLQFLTHDRLVLDNQHACLTGLVRSNIGHPGCRHCRWYFLRKSRGIPFFSRAVIPSKQRRDCPDFFTHSAEPSTNQTFIGRAAAAGSPRIEAKKGKRC